MHRFLLRVVVGVLIAAATRAAAEPANPSARLLYTRGADATHCPDENELRNTVSARLGYDPFRADAPGMVATAIARVGRGLRAVVELRDANGKVTGRRELSSNTTDCTELASAVALAISIAIDPLTLTRPAPPPPPLPKLEAPPKSEPAPQSEAPPKSEPPVEKPPAPPAARAPSPGPVGFRGAASVHVAFGVSPAIVAVGFTAQAGFRIRRFSIVAEGRADLPSSGDTARGRIETSLIGAALVPCFHAWWMELCGVGFAGALRGEAMGIASPRLDSHFYGAAGGRAGIAIPLWRALFLHVRAEVLASLTRITFTVNDLPAWTTPPVQGSVGIGALGQF